MATLDVLEELPAGYFVEESPRGVMAVHADAALPLLRFGYGPETDGPLAPGSATGRQPLLELDSEGERFLVRRFRHGGLLRWLTGGRFRDAERPFHELILSTALRRVGVPTPEVVAARARMSRAGGWTLDLVVRRIPDALDLGMVLALVRRGEVSPRALRSILATAGRLVRDLHLAGCLHADLNPNNLLVQRASLEGEEPRAWVLDLDRSALHQRLGSGPRRRNLRRLFRHVARRDRRLGRSLTTTDYARFLLAYDPSGTEWKEDWREVRSRHGRFLFWHTLGWFLEGRLARRRDPRERPEGEVLGEA